MNISGRQSLLLFVTALTIVLVVIVLWASYPRLSAPELDSQVGASTLTFSSTQEWDEDWLMFLNQTRSPNHITEIAKRSIVINQPPQNNSDTTTKELEFLHDLIKERTPEKLQEIESEKDLENVRFGSLVLFDETMKASYPHTVTVLNYANDNVIAVVLHFKQIFDRVRPSYLDKTLTTTISVPRHPAYPSGHSSQAYTFAHILGELDNNNKDTYLEAAYRVAHNREIAGVHYPSDSEAGRSLAMQYVQILFNDPEFLKLFAAAKTEW